MNILYLLGIGTPIPTKSRFGTSYILKLDKNYLMFDCEPATTYKLIKVGLSPIQISKNLYILQMEERLLFLSQGEAI